MREIQKKIDFLKTGVDPDGRIRTIITSVEQTLVALALATQNLALAEIYRTWRKVLEAYSSPIGDGSSPSLMQRQGVLCSWAIEGNLFNDWRYLDAVESGDVHTAVARICCLGCHGQVSLSMTKASPSNHTIVTIAIGSCAKSWDMAPTTEANLQPSPSRPTSRTSRHRFQPKYFHAFPTHLRWHDGLITSFEVLVSWLHSLA